MKFQSRLIKKQSFMNENYTPMSDESYGLKIHTFKPILRSSRSNNWIRCTTAGVTHERASKEGDDDESEGDQLTTVS